jgi:hypothetical protein
MPVPPRSVLNRQPGKVDKKLNAIDRLFYDPFTDDDCFNGFHLKSKFSTMIPIRLSP